MKKQLLFVLFVPLFSFTLLEWTTVNVDQRVSVQFPNQPRQTESSGNKVWIADVDINSRCMSMMLDYKQYGMDSAAVAVEMNKPESFENFKNGVLGQIKGASVIAEKTTTTLGKMTYEFVFDMGKKDTSSFNIMYSKNIFVGQKMYTLSFFEKSGNPQPAMRQKFMNSFRLN